MNERAAIFLGALAGAAAGSLAGYLFLTEGGRRLRAEWQPRLDDVLRNAAALRDTVERAGMAASEGWRTGSDDAQASRWSRGEQHAPF
jgi:gas vesicle protein